MRFVLSGAPLAPIDRSGSGADVAKIHVTSGRVTSRHGADQVAPRRARVHRIAAAGRESGIFRASFTHANSSSRFIISRNHAEDSGKRRITAGLAALSDT
jgi:hypothetical protein